MQLKLNDVKLVKGFSGIGVRFTLTKVWEGPEGVELTEAIRGCCAWRQKNGSIRVLPPTTYTNPGSKGKGKPFKATLWNPSLQNLLSQSIERALGEKMTRVDLEPTLETATEMVEV